MTNERIYQIYTSRGYAAARQVAELCKEQHLIDLVEKLQRDRRKRIEQPSIVSVAVDMFGMVYRGRAVRQAQRKAISANHAYA